MESESTRDHREQAEQLATRATSRAGSDVPKQIAAAIELTYARAPDSTEVQSALEFVQKNGLPALCRALLNSNEFLFVE